MAKTTCNCKRKAYSPARFRELFKEFTEKEDTIMAWKAEEYSSGEDRLQNFREIADFIGDEPITVTPVFVAMLFMLKHVQSIKNAIVNDNIRWAWETEGGEGTKQRVADTRNYLLFLAACIDEATGKNSFQQDIEKELLAMGFEEMPMTPMPGRRGDSLGE